MDYEGMTLNERLYHSGLMEDFEKKLKELEFNVKQLEIILKQVQIDKNDSKKLIKTLLLSD